MLFAIITRAFAKPIPPLKCVTAFLPGINKMHKLVDIDLNIDLIMKQAEQFVQTYFR